MKQGNRSEPTALANSGLLITEHTFTCAGCGGKEKGFRRSDKLPVTLTDYSRLADECKVGVYHFHSYECAGFLLVKQGNMHPEPSLHSGDLEVDFAQHRVTIAGLEVHLTVTEFRILSCLARNVGRMVTTSQILQKVWGDNYSSETHLLQVSIARLRKKLGEDVRNPRYILTRSGIGYILVEKGEGG